MEKISRSVHQAKQAKFLMLTVPVRTVRYGIVRTVMTWQDRTGRTVMMWQLFIGWLLANRVVTRVRLVANNMRTRGPIHGRHVSPSLLVYCCIKCNGSPRGSTPGPPLICNDFTTVR
jgi:hypothetical protein